MYRIRVVVTLLLHGDGLVKTVRFRKPRYIGDPINAVKILNDKEVDELVVLDISPDRHSREPNYLAIEDIVSEAFMPVAYGGGISTVDQIGTITRCGVEKCILCTAAHRTPELIDSAAERFGSQSTVVCIETKRRLWGKPRAFVNSGRELIDRPLSLYARELEQRGAGELFLYSIDRDGTYRGYDLDVLRSLASSVSIPVVACGGAGTLRHLREAVTVGNCAAVAAGSIFVYHGPRRAILITYPSQADLARFVYPPS